MLQKYLMIGVGGSGGKTLRYIWRELSRQLRAWEWDEGIPPAWQFLHIDVREKSDVSGGDVPRAADSAIRYVGLTKAPDDYHVYDEQLSRQSDLLPGLAGWRPDPTGDYPPVYLGAGQRRAVGRIVALSQLGRVGQALDDAIRVMAEPVATDPLKALNRHLEDRQLIDPDLASGHESSVIFFSSLGGGSGSGAFLDIIELLCARADSGEANAWLRHGLFSVLYSGDVFKGITPSNGIQPNTLAALSELMAAMDHEGTVSNTEGRLLDAGGAVARLSGTRVGRSTFMIGIKNAEVEFGSATEVYEATGRAISSIILNDRVKSSFDSYIGTNSAPLDIRDDFLLTTKGRLSSFGFATVSLGRNVFSDFTVGRLARRALERILRGHLTGALGDTVVNEEAELQRHVARLEAEFFKSSGLSELGKDENQVLDALRGEIPEMKGLLDQARTKTMEVLGEVRDDLSPSEMSESVKAARGAAERIFDAATNERRHRLAVAWVSSVQQTLLNTTGRYVGLYGAPVTIGLLDGLQRQMRDAATELRNGATALTTDNGRILAGIPEIFDRIREKAIGTGHKAVTSVLDQSRDGLRRGFEGRIHLQAANLLVDAAENLIAPLRRELQRAFNDLAQAENTSAAEMINEWAVDNVPRSLTPAKTEVLLEPIEQFPDVLESLLDELVDHTGWRAGESQALEEIISGTWPSVFEGADRAVAPLIGPEKAWIPSDGESRASSQTPQSGWFRIELAPVVLEERVEKWVRNRRGPIRRHVSETLGEWLSAEHPDARKRANDFVDRLATAMARSQPLISMNREAYKRLHGNEPGHPATIVSPIPLAPGHAAYKLALELLTQRGLPESDAAAAFKPGYRCDGVEISTFTPSPMHPIVFDSVSVPILRDWQAQVDSSSRRAFWRFRRARQLRAFVPIPPSRLQAMIRGWITAEILGYIDEMAGSWSAGPLSIWTPEGRKTFPVNLLCGDVASRGDVLPALVETLPVAMMMMSTGNLTEIDAYRRLVELGLNSDGTASETTSLHPNLAQWLVSGEVARNSEDTESAPSPSSFAGPSDGTMPERAEAVHVWITEFDEGYGRFADQKITATSSLTVGRGWELHDIVVEAARALNEAVTHCVQAATPDVGGSRTGPSR